MVTEKREGSRMVLGGNEVYVRRMFPPEMIKDESGVSMPNGTAMVETMEGAYLFLNGEFVKEREALETLPEQHKVKALAWWDEKFGNGGGTIEAKAIAEQEISSVPVSILESLAAQMASLQERVAALEKKGNGRRAHTPARHRRQRSAEVPNQASIGA